MSDDRIRILEEKLAHMELAVSELDATVYRQQQALDELGRRLRRVDDKLARLSERVEAGNDADNAPPPHY